MASYDLIPDSSSVLASGSFKARDEMRRAEEQQRRKIQMGERLDRNINRAIRRGDSRSADSFLGIRQAITGQAYGGGGGITNHDDMEARVKDGTLKGAKIRDDMGNIGRTNNGLIAEAPPVDSVTPKNRTSYDGDGNGIPDSIQRPVNAGQPPLESVQTNPVALGSQMTPEALKSRQAFASDLDRSELIKSDPAARERAYAKGESIGVSRGEVNRRQGWGGDTGPPVSAMVHQEAQPEGQQYQSISPASSQFSSLTNSGIKRDLAADSIARTKGVLDQVAQTNELVARNDKRVAELDAAFPLSRQPARPSSLRGSTEVDTGSPKEAVAKKARSFPKSGPTARFVEDTPSGPSVTERAAVADEAYNKATPPISVPSWMEGSVAGKALMFLQDPSGSKRAYDARRLVESYSAPSSNPLPR